MAGLQHLAETGAVVKRRYSLVELVLLILIVAAVIWLLALALPVK